MTAITPAMLLLTSLSLLHTKLSKRIDNMLSLHGISFTEFMVMYHLSTAADMTMRRIDLAESIGLSASGVTRLLLPMQKIKLVKKERNSRDARVSLVRLSKAGQEILDDALVSFEQVSTSLLKTLKPKQIEKFLGLVERLG